MTYNQTWPLQVQILTQWLKLRNKTWHKCILWASRMSPTALSSPHPWHVSWVISTRGASVPTECCAYGEPSLWRQSYAIMHGWALPHFNTLSVSTPQQCPRALDTPVRKSSYSWRILLKPLPFLLSGEPHQEGVEWMDLMRPQLSAKMFEYAQEWITEVLFWDGWVGG